MERVLEVARALAAKSPVALAAAKEATNRALRGDHARTSSTRRRCSRSCSRPRTQKEGMAAFIEKRNPSSEAASAARYFL